MQASLNLYRTLQVDPAAEDGVIRAAYRALMKRHHPDHGGSMTFAQALNQAYATLADPIARRAYDRMLRSARHASAPGSGATAPTSAPSAGGEAGAAPRRDTRTLVVQLGEALAKDFVPSFPERLAAVFDFVGARRGALRHRVWVKRLSRGDATDARAFQSAVEAARLARPVWDWGSDLFVAALPVPTADVRRLVRGPGGFVPGFSHAIILLDLVKRDIDAIGRTHELPSFEALAAAAQNRASA